MSRRAKPGDPGTVGPLQRPRGSRAPRSDVTDTQKSCEAPDEQNRPRHGSTYQFKNAPSSRDFTQSARTAPGAEPPSRWPSTLSAPVEWSPSEEVVWGVEPARWSEGGFL